MRPIVQTLTAAGAGAWLPLNRLQTPANISLYVGLNSAANLTYSVQHTFGTFDNLIDCSVQRTLTTVTVVTRSNHGLVTGDSAIITGGNYWGSIEKGTAVTGIDGTYTVTVTNATTFTYTSGTSGTLSTTALSASCCPLKVVNHAVLVSQTTSADSNYAFPPTACRLNITSFTAGQATLTVISGSGSD